MRQCFHSILLWKFARPSQQRKKHGDFSSCAGEASHHGRLTSGILPIDGSQGGQGVQVGWQGGQVGHVEEVVDFSG